MFKVLTRSCEPTRGSKYSACVDLYASEDVVIGAGETKLVGLGVAIDNEKIAEKFEKPTPSEIIEAVRNVTVFDEYGYEQFLNSHYLQLMLRSSLAKKGLIIANGAGVIDLDYKDEIKMILTNVSYNGNYKIKKGDCIAQITLLEHKSHLFGIESDEERKGGFGSTGG